MASLDTIQTGTTVFFPPEEELFHFGERCGRGKHAWLVCIGVAKSHSFLRLLGVSEELDNECRKATSSRGARIQSTAKKSEQDETTCSVDNVSFFPSYTIPAKTGGVVNPEVAYLSPPLAFNIGLHVSWLDVLIRRGFEEQHSGEDQFMCSLEVHPLPKTSVTHHAVQKFLHGLSQYAAHVRIAHIRTPALAASLSNQKDYRAASKKDRQARIDAALAHYFECDRLLAEGDILSIRVPPPDSFLHASFGDVCTAQEELIHFKVLGLEPSPALSFLVNRHKTALVLGGAEPSCPGIDCSYSTYAHRIVFVIVELLAHRFVYFIVGFKARNLIKNDSTHLRQSTAYLSMLFIHSILKYVLKGLSPSSGIFNICS